MTKKGEDPTVAAEAFASRFSSRGYNFDFSRNSLENEVDRLLESDELDKLETADHWAVEADLSAYIGEAVARLFGGEWTGQFWRDNPGPNFYASWLEFKNVPGDAGEPYRFYPSRFIGYRISNGPAEGTFADYFNKEASRLEG